MGLSGMRGISELRTHLSLLGFLSDVLLVVLPLFVLFLFLCLFFGFRRRPTGIGRAAFFWFLEHGGFSRRLYIEDVYVRTCLSSPRSNSLFSPNFKDIAFSSRFSSLSLSLYFQTLLQVSLSCPFLTHWQ
jgi:hypothetical protein